MNNRFILIVNIDFCHYFCGDTNLNRRTQIAAFFQNASVSDRRSTSPDLIKAL